MTGTARMRPGDVGGYILLLCEQWQTGSVPGDDPCELAVLMHCTRAMATSIWTRIHAKFVRGSDGLWRNARLEHVRVKQEAFREKQAQKARAAIEARRRQSAPPVYCGSAAGHPEYQPEGSRTPTNWPPERQPNGTSSIFDLRSSVRTPDLGTSESDLKAATTTPAAGVGVAVPRRFDRAHAGHVHGFCGFKCLSEQKLQEFSCDLPGGAADPANFDRALTWAELVRDTWGDKPKLEFEWFKFWEARWKERTPTATKGAQTMAAGKAWAARKAASGGDP